MVEKLSVSIALLGGDEVERQLAGIGAAGQKAFADIDKAAQKVGGFENLDPKVVQDKLKQFGVTSVEQINKVRAAVSKAADFEKLVQGIQAAEAAFQRFGQTVSAVGARLTSFSIAAIALGGGLIKASLDASKGIQDIVTQASKLGLTVEQFDQLRRGFESAGISSKAIADGLQHLQGVLDKLNIERVNKAFTDLQQLVQSSGKAFAEGTVKLNFLREAAQGVGPVADAAREALTKLGTESPLKPLSEQLGPLQTLLKEIGLSIDSFDKALLQLDPDKLIQIIAKLQAMPDTVNRSKLAIALFGDQLGVELVQAFRTGSITLDAFKNKIGALTSEQVRAAAEQQQALNKLSTAWERFKQQFAAPIATKLLDFARQDLEQFGRDLQANTGIAQQWLARIQAVFRGAVSGDLFKGMFDKFKQDFAKVGTDLEAIQAFIKKWVTTPVADAWKWLVDTFQAAIRQIATLINQGKLLFNNWVTTPAAGAWQWLINTFNGVVANIFASMGRIRTEFNNWVTTPVANAWQWLVDTFNATVDKIKAAIDSARTIFNDWVGTPVANAWQWLIDTFNAVIAQLPALGRSIATAISTLVTTPVANAWQWLVTTLDGVLAQLKAKIDAFFNSLNQQAGQGIASGSEFGGLGDTGGGGGLAGGGLIGGRGTGTSDSNLAWVSRGEHIMPARAVAQPGVLALLEALRRSGGDLRRVLDGMGRFALGGMVMPRTMPAFAGGGLNTGSPVTINFPGLPPISGLRASANTVDELKRAAAMAQVRSGGRKPSRYS